MAAAPFGAARPDGPETHAGGVEKLCQMSAIPDSIGSNFSELGRGPVGHLHLNGQPKLTHCAKYRASVMRDGAAVRVGDCPSKGYGNSFDN